MGLLLKEIPQHLFLYRRAYGLSSLALFYYIFIPYIFPYVKNLDHKAFRCKVVQRNAGPIMGQNNTELRCTFRNIKHEDVFGF